MKHTLSQVVLLLVALTTSSLVHASDQFSNTQKELDAIFSEAGVQGTFVLFNVSTNHFVYHDKARASTRFIPASTFKIPNSLIGLSTGAVNSVDEVLPYGGKPQHRKSWEHDMGLRDAIKISNVPVYRELARRIGLQTMRENVSRLDYGNAEIGDVVDLFWLNGPLKISALEQTKFLARLAQGDLPFSSEVQQQVREIAMLEEGDGWVLYGKTGWEVKSTAHIGWWVGWVVKDQQIFSFAVNIDMPNISDAGKRIEIGKAALKLLEVL